jgi:hypothetical protein
MKRAALAAVLLAALLGVTPSASASTPRITLLTPTNGTTLAVKPYGDGTTTFTWHVTWDTPESTTIMFQLGTDPSFAAGTFTGDNFFCPAPNPNCTTSYAPPRSYSPPFPHTFYWRVGLTTSAGIVWSSPSMFKVVAQVDRTKPRVQVLAGSAKRGKRARMLVRAADDGGRVRLRVSLAYHGRTLYSGQMPMTATSWGQALMFYSNRPLPRLLPAGRYQACARAWDESGNTARSCAWYRIR